MIFNFFDRKVDHVLILNALPRELCAIVAGPKLRVRPERTEGASGVNEIG